MSVSASGNYGVVAAAAGGEEITLHGTLSVPILVTYVSIHPLQANAHWIFGVDDQPFNSIERGQVQKDGYSSGGDLPTFTSVNIDTDWVIPNDFQSGPYFIRAQLKSGDDVPFQATLEPLSVIGTADNPADWFTLTNGGVFAEYRWNAPNSITPRDATIKVDISTSASEAGIQATGYYKAVASVFQL